MGRVEMLLLVGAIAIFGRFSLTINSSRYTNEFWVIQSETQTVAASLAAGILEEAAQKAFDEAAIGRFLSGGVTDLTAPSLLGPEGGENYPAFDDIDDYDQLAMTVTGANGIQYQLQASVCYVSRDNPNSQQTTQTYYKKLTVSVTSDFMPNPITLSRVYAFYHAGVTS